MSNLTLRVGAAMAAALIIGPGCAKKPDPIHPAIAACTDFARQLMKSPEAMTVAMAVGEGTPRVILDVRAPNAYGTMVRSVIGCDMEELGVGWTAVGATIDGRKIEGYELQAALFGTLAVTVNRRNKALQEK